MFYSSLVTRRNHCTYLQNARGDGGSTFDHPFSVQSERPTISEAAQFKNKYNQQQEQFTQLASHLSLRCEAKLCYVDISIIYTLKKNDNIAVLTCGAPHYFSLPAAHATSDCPPQITPRIHYKEIPIDCQADCNCFGALITYMETAEELLTTGGGGGEGGGLLLYPITCEVFIQCWSAMHCSRWTPRDLSSLFYTFKMLEFILQLYLNSWANDPGLLCYCFISY